MSREQMLREASSVFCEFLEVAVHTLLYTRGVYPPEIFERRRKYNIPVRQSRYKELSQYIAGAVQGAHFWMVKGVLEKVVLCIEDKATGRKLERFVWEIDFDMAASPALSTSSRVLTEPRNHEELEDALRQVLLKISISDSLLPPQKRKDVTFNLYVHTAEHRYAVDNDWEAVEEDDAPAAGDDGGRLRGAAEDSPGALVPLKSVRAGPMHVQLYAMI